MTRNIYIGLLTNKGTEPSVESGYNRLAVNTVDGQDVSQLLHECTLIFADSVEKGYGTITHLVVYDSLTSNDCLYTWELPKPVEVHTGVIPFIHNGNLYRGIALDLKPLTSGSDSVCGVSV